MPFLVNSHISSFLQFINYFRVNQIEFRQVFDKLTFKHMDALREQIQSLVYCV